MTLPVSTKNNMLDGQSFTQLSLHTDYPGTTGSSEVTGGTPAYARKAITLPGAAGGQRVGSTTITFDVPPTTVRWVGAWNGATFIGGVPNGGAAPRQFGATPTASRIYVTAHGYALNQKVVFFNGTPPAPLVEGAVYFCVNVLTNDFMVAATAGGAPIVLTSGPGYGCNMSAITEEVYAVQGTHSILSYTFAIPD